MNALGWLMTVELGAVAVACAGWWRQLDAPYRGVPRWAHTCAMGGALAAAGCGVVLIGAAGYVGWWPLVAAMFVLCGVLGALISQLRLAAATRRRRAVAARLHASAARPAGRHHVALKPQEGPRA